MKKLILILLLSTSAKAAPLLYFSDLQSGPKTGGLNNKGAWITVYGTGFGATQSTSTMTVGGGLVDNCPFWGIWLWYQKITCQLGSSAATGNIVVTVGGVSSNTLPFTVRSGSIYFVDVTSGLDTNNGAIGTPWQHLGQARNSISNGDIVYIRAGTATYVDSGSGATLDISSTTGAINLPKAFIGYPNETATIACDGSIAPGNRCYDILANTGGPVAYYTFAELDLGCTTLCHYLVNWDNATGGNGLRFIGNLIHGALSINVTFAGPMDPNDFLGNDDYDYWSLTNGANDAERGYGLYYEGYGTQHPNVQYNRFYNDEGTILATSIVNVSGTAITWVSGDQFTSNMNNHYIWLNGSSYHHITAFVDATHLTSGDSLGTNNGITSVIGGGSSTKGIQIYGHINGDFFTHTVIANNKIYNNCLEGILAGGSDGSKPNWGVTDPLYIYNNLFVNNGSCDTINGQAYSAIETGDGVSGMNVKIWNNSFYLSAGGTLGNVCAGDIYIFPFNEQFDLSNNIFFAQPVTTSYQSYVCLDPNGSGSTLTGSNNIFFANGSGLSAPGFVSGTVSTADPKYVSPSINNTTGDFHLQSSSPAKLGGITLSTTSPDLDGCTRPQGATFGLGAYEFVVNCNSGGGGGGSTFYFPGHK